MQDSYKEFKKVREFGDLFTDTFNFISHNYKSFFGGFLKLVWPFLAFGLIASTYYQIKVTGSFFSGAFANPDNPMAFFSNFSFAFIFLIIGTFLIGVASYAYVNLYIKNYIETSGNVQLSEVKQQMYDRFISITGLQFIVGLSIFVGLMICLFPGIYLLVPLSFAVSVYVFEDKSVTDAFSHTFRLIRNNWWITFAALVVMYLVVTFAGFIFQLPLFLYTAIKTALSIQDSAPQQFMQGMSTDYVLLALNAIATFISFLFNVAFIIMTVYIYFNLNERHYGTGSFEQIDELGTD